MAQLSTREARELQKIIDQLNQDYDRLGLSSQKINQTAQDYAQNLNSAAEAMAQVNQLQTLLSKSAEGLEAKYQSIANTIQKIVTAQGRNSEENTKLNRAGNLQVSIAQKLQSHAEGVAKLSSDELRLSKMVLKIKGDTSSELYNYTKEQLKAMKQEEAALGRLKGLLGAMSKIPIIGGAIDTAKAMKTMETALDAGASKSKAMALGLGAAMKSMVTGLGPVTMMVSAFNFIKDAVFAVDKNISDIAKGLNVSYGEAQGIQASLNQTAINTGDWAIRASTLGKTLTDINESLGISVQLTEKELVFMTQLREKAGLSAEEINKMYLLTKATGQDQEKYTASVLASAKSAAMRAGVVLNEKQILKDTLNTTKAMQLSLGGNADALARAAVEAKKVGVSMEKLEGIASSLLDFESSISAELEAELLTGKNLNMEKARLAAINNDVAGLAKEIAANYGDAAEFTKMNRLQQEALAKAVGMTREELAGSLLEAKAIGNATGEEAERRREAFELAKERYGLAEAQRRLEKDGIETIMDQNAQQDRFNAAVEKVKETFANIASGPFLSIVEGFTKLLSNTTALKVMLAGVAGIMAAIAISAITSAVAATGGLAAIPIALGIAGASVAMYTALDGAESQGPQAAKKVGDAMIDPQGGLVISDPTEGALYQLSGNDGVVAAPMSKGTGTQDRSTSKMEALLERIAVATHLTSRRDLSIDSQRFGSIASVSSYEVGTAYS